MSPLVALAVAVVVAVAPAEPSDAEIAQAIDRLSNGRFVERERASRWLWQAGARAEPALKQAAQAGEPETVRRVSAILDKFKWGIYPDTPAPVVELIARYRSADTEGKRKVTADLLTRGRPGYAALKRLAALEDKPEDRSAVVEQIARDARKVIAALLLADDLDTAQELLEACLAGEGDDAYADYATFLGLHDRLPSAIQQFERLRSQAADENKQAESPSPEQARAATTLIYLYRAKGDFASARRLVDQTYKDDLLDALLWVQGDWKGLMGRPMVRLRWGGMVGLEAAYQRLAGDTEAFGKTIEELRTQARADAADRHDIRGIAESLLLNNHTADGIDALVNRRKNLAMAFDLLGGQLRYREALALEAPTGDEAEGEDEGGELSVRRARGLVLLGDRDSGVQLFNQASERIRRSGDSRAARTLIKTMTRLGLKDQAAAAAAEFLARQGRADERGRELFEPLFPRQAEAAEVWWRFLRGQATQESATATMTRLRSLLAPPAGDASQAKANAEQLAKFVDQIPNIKDKGVAPWRGWSAAAAVAEANHLDAEQRSYLEKAAESGNSVDSWVALGDYHARHNKEQDAATAYARAVDRDPAQALPLFLRGQMLIRLGQREAGERLVKISHIIPLGGEYPRAQFIEELSKRGYHDDARIEIDRVLAYGWHRHWSVGNVLNQAARDAGNRQEYDRAADAYEKSLISCLKNGASFIDASAYLAVPQAVPQLRARARLAEGKIEAALAEAKAALAIMPGSVDLAIQLTPELDKLGRKAEADQLFERVLAPYEQLCRDYPNSSFAHNSAAWLAAGCRRQLDTALEHANKAVALSPKATGYLDTLAEVHFRRGEREKALEIMKKCRELEPANAYYRRQSERFAKGDPAGPAPDESESDEG